MAIRELEIFIHPCLCRSWQFRGEFASREHCLVIAVRQMVAIHRYAVELVVKPDRLGLLIGWNRTLFRRLSPIRF